MSIEIQAGFIQASFSRSLLIYAATQFYIEFRGFVTKIVFGGSSLSVVQ